ncbi:MAG TPA: rhomboid family intramembrane serine protease [Saprospiraceae bacterium]|nr:rhomboid family intramembrane serine protease [Saprospiraceae bacterium]MCB9270825.1 rhomboid family intramembrane serine protease [Lewinellaceae bacterium]HPG05805.1 rhomboid family intramembrane serine protease [Saprospiraceae bacterium]HRV86985.1 rhomboid family intramembrane serine protease [Saprospiraceae bacterium]
MFQSIWQDIRQIFQHGHMLNRIIVVNLAVWVVVLLGQVFLKGAGWYGPFIQHLELSSDWREILFRPWTLITHMFLHEGLFHILFNLLVLYWFGRIVGDFIGDHRVLPLYLLGGLAGAVFFFFSANIQHPGITHYALGASAAVTCFILTSAWLSPNYEMHLLLIGPVKIKYIAFFVMLLDLVGVANNANSGGHFAHLGGAVMGIAYVEMLRRGDDLAYPFIRFFNWLGHLGQAPVKNPPPRTAVLVKHPAMRSRQKLNDYQGMSHQEKLDAILDKIKAKGYEKLSDEEKAFLTEASKKD